MIPASPKPTFDVGYMKTATLGTTVSRQPPVPTGRANNRQGRSGIFTMRALAAGGTGGHQGRHSYQPRITSWAGMNQAFGLRVTILWRRGLGRKGQTVDSSGLPLRGALLGLEIGTSQSTLPVGAGRFGRTPHIVLSGAFLALRASDCIGWPRRWVSGRRRDWDPGRTCRIPA
jgi:hypothetical protein